MLKTWPFAVTLLLTTGAGGCCCPRTEVTCYSLSNPCEPEGMPYYLPKPLLIVTKNFRGVEDNGVGQLGTAPIPTVFDNQAQYADVKANISSSVAPSTGPAKTDNGTPSTAAKPQVATTGDTLTTTNNGVVPPGTFKDGVTPDTFYTYHIVFVPDLTQKYAIKIKGGAGEFRAAMSLVNGWMFTGLGPFYLKDSSTAQNILAVGGAITLGGRGVADVVSSLADLSKAAAKPQLGTFDSSQVAGRVSEIKLLMDQNGLKLEPISLPAFAEIHVFEAYLQDGHMEWRPIVEKSFDRMILGVVNKTTVTPPTSGSTTVVTHPPGGATTIVPGGATPPITNPPPGTPIPAKTPMEPKGPPGTPEAGLFDQSSAVEDRLKNAVANQFIGLLSQAKAQAGTPGGSTATPGAGNNVTVNVNQPRLCSCDLLKWCKPRPKNAQSIVVGSDGNSMLDVGEAGSNAGGPPNGPAVIMSGPAPTTTTRVSN